MLEVSGMPVCSGMAPLLCKGFAKTDPGWKLKAVLQGLLWVSPDKVRVVVMAAVPRGCIHALCFCQTQLFPKLFLTLWGLTWFTL